jgi:hypothetical protein
MRPTISYYNGVSDLHRHESMKGQLDRTSSKDSPCSNTGIDLVLEEQSEPIAGLVVEDVFVLPSEFQARSTSDEAEGESERLVTIHGFVLVKSSNLTVIPSFYAQNQVLIVCMTQDQLFHTYGQKC